MSFHGKNKYNLNHIPEKIIALLNEYQIPHLDRTLTALDNSKKVSIQVSSNKSLAEITLILKDEKLAFTFCNKQWLFTKHSNDRGILNEEVNKVLSAEPDGAFELFPPFNKNNSDKLGQEKLVAKGEKATRKEIRKLLALIRQYYQVDLVSSEEFHLPANLKQLLDVNSSLLGKPIECENSMFLILINADIEKASLTIQSERDVTYIFQNQSLTAMITTMAAGKIEKEKSEELIDSCFTVLDKIFKEATQPELSFS